METICFFEGESATRFDESIVRECQAKDKEVKKARDHGEEGHSASRFFFFIDLFFVSFSFMSCPYMLLLVCVFILFL